MKFKTTIMFLLSLLVITGCSKKTTEQTKVDTGNHFQFSYEVTVPHQSKAFKTGEVFIPIPQSDEFQTVNDIAITTNGTYEILSEDEYGNKYAKINFDSNLESDLNITLTVDIIRKVQDNFTTNSMKVTETPELLARYLLADSLVPIDGVIENEADSLVTDSMTVIEKSHALFNHLFRTMAYDKSGEGWGRGDALYACDIRKGNCTDFHSLFIGMARSENIPARFLIGFPTPADKDSATIGGYHCWAEFYDNDHGWVPVDISETAKDSTKKDFLFGNLDNDRLVFSIGRDIKVASATGEKSLNFFVYPYVFIDGVQSSDFTKKFEFKKL